MAAKYRRPVKKTLQRRTQKRDEIDSNFKEVGASGRQQPLDCNQRHNVELSLNPRISIEECGATLAGPTTPVNGPLSTPMDEPRNFTTEDRFNFPR